MPPEIHRDPRRQDVRGVHAYLSNNGTLHPPWAENPLNQRNLIWNSTFELVGISTAWESGIPMSLGPDINEGFLLARHLGRGKGAGALQSDQISVGKLNNFHETRTILGDNVITLDHSPLRDADNLESGLTHEGADELKPLVLGRMLTGVAAFRRTQGTTAEDVPPSRLQGAPSRPPARLDVKKRRSARGGFA